MMVTPPLLLLLHPQLLLFEQLEQHWALMTTAR
jgi:hypothetical protein